MLGNEILKLPQANASDVKVCVFMARGMATVSIQEGTD